MRRAPTLTLFLLLAPALFLIGLLALYPILRVLALSVFRTEYGLAGAQFVGLANYADLLGDRFFRRAGWNTVLFTLLATLFEVALGLLLALLFNRRFAGRRWLMPAVIFPFVLSTMVVSAIWRAWFHFDYGLLNNLLRALGLAPVKWLFDPDIALLSIVLVDVWQTTPIAFLILLAGLQSIPAEVVEAARLDGAGRLQVLRLITLPLLSRHLLLAALLRTIESFKLFDKVFALTGGGPGNATETLSLAVYRSAFRFAEVGYASAAATLMLVIAALLAAFYAFHIMRGAGR